ncbi:MAG: ABC transporter substrate-binding protein [Candidatus Thioglobus sp.]|nr:ABC transporter substrate-binding protein [Candidatus Thioglobus sp.]
MKSIYKKIGATVVSAIATVNVMALDELNVAYFEEWPMPFEYAKQIGAYDEALGMTVNWKSFGTGTAMSAAMASGDIDISVSQGVPPFIVAASTGQDIQIVDVAVSYADNDNCVVASALEIDASNASELAGKKVSVPIGTAAHYGYLKQMEHFGVSVDSMQVVDMAPPEGAAAFAQGELDMFCGWGGSLRRALGHGNVLLSGAEKTALGILVWDVTSTPAGFADENAEVLATFLGVTAASNAMWNSGGFTSLMLPHIARDAGMDEDATADTMSTFVFPSVSNQLGSNWLGGSGADFLKGVADVFVNSGNIPSARGSYANAINTDGLEALAAQ